MGINIQRCAGLCMTQQTGNRADINTLCNQQAGIGMAQAMHTQIQRQVVSLQNQLESICECARAHRLCNGIFNHTSLCQFYQGRLLLQVTIPFEEKPTSNLPGDNLRYYRQRKSLTTRQLAEQIDVVPATILMYEQNKHPIPFDVANSLADALDVNADLLYDDFAVFLVTPYSEALKDIRMSIGMSQRAFAEHIGVIPSYYYKLESGHRRPSRKVYQRMVDTLSHTHP